MSDFNVGAMGVETGSSVTTLDSEAGIAYALATNDPTPLHLDGTFIPPIYAVVPVWEKVFEVVSGVVPEEHFFSVVHGEQDMIFHQPLRAGMALRSHAIGESISVKDSGTTLIVKSESVDDVTGQPVIEQYFTMFYRKVDGGVTFGEPHDNGLDTDQYEEVISQGDKSEAFIKAVEAHMDDDQTFRYAQASGDFMPIHIDDEFARSVGLGGIIIHGLCTMAQASWAAISALGDSDPTRLKRMAVRFSHPLRPGDDLTTTFFLSPGNSSDSEIETYYLVSTRSSDDEIILTNSYVELGK